MTPKQSFLNALAKADSRRYGTVQPDRECEELHCHEMATELVHFCCGAVEPYCAEHAVIRREEDAA